MEQTKPKFYLGNPNLRGTGVEIDFEAWQVAELARCAEDPIYFFENYINIVSLDEGKILFKPYEFQKNIVRTMVDNRFVICKIPRQQGKTTTVAALLVWYILFHDDFQIAVLAHKKEQSLEIMSRIQLAYEMLPYWLQQGVKIWNKGDIQLENGSKIEAEATSSGSIRGRTYNIVYLDEFAHVEPNVQEDFFTSTYPTITSGKTTKILITSTPKGLEYFYKIWSDSEKGKNSYVRVEANWWDVPGRDEAWKEETIRNTSARQFEQEFECGFLGSSSTLIDGKKLAVIPTMDPLPDEKGNPPKGNSIWIYEPSKPGHRYVIMVDTSRGKGIDFSAFVVFDVTQFPYRIVARFRDNMIASMLYPNVVHRAAKQFNDAFVLVETNDVGAQVADILLHEMEYENLFMSQIKGRAGQQLGGGLGLAQRQIGIKMSKGVKAIGCNALKTIVESDRLIINDQMVLSELSTFVVHKNSYAADEGKHDDLAMCLVMFAWVVNQDYFKELMETDIRLDLESENQDFIEGDLTPFGFIDAGAGSDYDGGDEWFYDDPDFGRWAVLLAIGTSIAFALSHLPLSYFV